MLMVANDADVGIARRMRTVPYHEATKQGRASKTQTAATATPP